MASKIRVFGKTHNRTALGIVNAYLIIHPETTLQQLRVIFPDSINPISNQKEMFVDVTQVQDPSKLDGYFTKPEELLIMGDGKKVAMYSQWPLESLQRLIDKGKNNGIEVADFEPADNSIGCKGGYYIEFLDNWKPAAGVMDKLAAGLATIAVDAGTAEAAAATSTVKAQAASEASDPIQNSNIPANASAAVDDPYADNSDDSDDDDTVSSTDEENLGWLWVLIGLVFAGLFIWAICRSYQSHKAFADMEGSEVLAQIQPSGAIVEALPLEAVNVDSLLDGASYPEAAQVQSTVPTQRQNAEAVQQQEVDPQQYMVRFTQLQHQFNGIEYKNAKAELSDSAKHVLNQVAALMEQYPSLDLRIEGHTSSSGRAMYNMKLSQKRAEAVAQYLQSKGISADRLVAVGMGEAKPVDPANPNGSDNRVTCLFNISHNEARAQKASLVQILEQEVSQEGPIQ